MYNILIESEMNSCCKKALIVDGKGRKLELATSLEKMEYLNALRNLTAFENEQTKPNPTMTNPDKHYLFNVYDTENHASKGGGIWRVLQITFFY